MYTQTLLRTIEMSDVKPRWRPQALRQVSSDFDTPSGFTPIRVVGMGGLTGMSADFIEPDKITTPSDWESLVADLDQWGEVPDPSTISSISSEETSRGLVLQISAELEWIAEFLPWGSDGLLRTRSRNAPENFDAPTGGFFLEGKGRSDPKEEI